MQKSIAGVARVALMMVVALGIAPLASANTITFEVMPGGGTPAEGIPVSNQWQASHGVRFALIGGGFPVIAEVGGIGQGENTTAFNSNDGFLTAGSQGLGNYFLTDDGCLIESSPGVPCAPPQGLIIYYSSPVNFASGQLIDLDGTNFNSEQWEVQAYGGYLSANGALLTNSVLTPLLDTQVLNGNSMNAGDGLVTPFAFSETGILAIQLRWTGTNLLAGFALDNFSPPDLDSFFTCPEEGPCTPSQLTDFEDLTPTSVPEPSTIGTMLAGAAFVAYRRFRKARA